MTISLVQGSLTFPENFQLIVAMNPCPCGYYGDPILLCTYSSSAVNCYQKRISGSLMDYVVIYMQVPRLEYQELRDMRPKEVRKYCALDEPCQVTMMITMHQSLANVNVWDKP